MKPYLILLSLLVAGCSGTVLMVNPKTGERVTCGGRGFHPGMDIIQSYDCARQHEALGFVRAENLTAQQKAPVTP